MTVQVTSEENSLKQLLEGLFRNLSNQDSLNVLRSKAWDRYQQLGLPTRKSEVFRYMPLRKFFASIFSEAEEIAVDAEQIAGLILPECKDSVVVFVNGFFQPTLSRMKGIPSKITLSSINDAVHSFSGFFTNSWTKSLKEELDPFAALNAALHPRGAFLYVPPKTVVETPIQILQVGAGVDAALMMPRLHVFVGAQSELRLVSTNAVLSGSEHLTNTVLDLHLEEDARVKCFQHIAYETESSWHFHAYRSTLKRGAVFKTVDITEGSLAVRTDYRINLAGEAAEALLNNLWMLSGKREAHSHVLIDHQAPQCHSMQLFKGALADFSRSSFEGKILVQRPAQKTDAFQLNNNLLLSERAHADSKPNLEIFADDVKASHGATFGQLDEDYLFYMRSRGIPEKEAKALLVYGYCKEILEMISIPSLLEEIRRRAFKRLTKE